MPEETDWLNNWTAKDADEALVFLRELAGRGSMLKTPTSIIPVTKMAQVVQGIYTDFCGNTRTMNKAIAENQTLRSDLSKREAEIGEFINLWALLGVGKLRSPCGQCGKCEVCKIHKILKDTASVAQAHDDKVARGVWKRAMQLCDINKSISDLRCEFEIRSREAKAEQGGKDGA